ncbi:DLW-39 family protein [Brooklawnia sp.]
MKRPLLTILATAALAWGFLAWQGYRRNRAEAELWAAATDEI